MQVIKSCLTPLFGRLLGGGGGGESGRRLENRRKVFARQTFQTGELKTQKGVSDPEFLLKFRIRPQKNTDPDHGLK